MKVIPEDTKQTLKVQLTEHTVRVKGNNKVSRFFSRNYGHDKKVLKHFKEAGFKEGTTEISLKEFIATIEDLKSLVERSVKKVLKAKIGDEVEVLTASNRARRVYKQVLKQEKDIQEPIVLLKKDRNLVEIKIREKEEEESLDFDEFF